MQYMDKNFKEHCTNQAPAPTLHKPAKQNNIIIKII